MKKNKNTLLKGVMYVCKHLDIKNSRGRPHKMSLSTSLKPSFLVLISLQETTLPLIIIE